jgi:hypothetical protein
MKAMKKTADGTLKLSWRCKMTNWSKVSHHNTIPLGNTFDMNFVAKKFSVRKDLFESLFGG